MDSNRESCLILKKPEPIGRVKVSKNARRSEKRQRSASLRRVCVSRSAYRRFWTQKLASNSRYFASMLILEFLPLITNDFLPTVCVGSYQSMEKHLFTNIHQWYFARFYPPPPCFEPPDNKGGKSTLNTMIPFLPLCAARRKNSETSTKYNQD